MSYREAYESWLSNPYFDEDTKEELRSIANDEKEIEDRFYMDLEFGTAGLRGVIGAGTNRMNVYTVRKATQGLANYIICLLYTSDAADEEDSVDLGGRRIIKKKKRTTKRVGRVATK